MRSTGSTRIISTGKTCKALVVSILVPQERLWVDDLPASANLGYHRRAPCDRFNVLHLEPLKRSLKIEGHPLGLDRRLERRCFRRQSQPQLECHLGQARVRLAHRAEQVFSFVFGHILWIVGEHCLRTRGEGWIVGGQKPLGSADRFAYPQNSSGLLETPAWPHGWTVG